ncbi:MAG: hypothetical protein SFV24_05945 [Gemmatimonadales bacterium]|nr:hypothetical protein [Gemmatimonadales bacterium]
MRCRRLLSLMLGWVLGAAGCSSAVTMTPVDAGLVPLDNTGDGGTLWLYGDLSRDAFRVDSMRAVPTRLASRSPDPDEFRVMLVDAQGEPRQTVRFWSPLGVHVWDSTGTREQYRTRGSSKVAIPVPVRPWLARVRLLWPPGQAVGEVEVTPEVKRFCGERPQNPSCRQ